MSKSVDDLIRDLEAGGVVEGGGVPAAPARAPTAKRAVADTPSGRAIPLVVIAVILVALLGSLPFGSTVLYPFALFVTLLHESSHALAAMLSGGSVVGLTVSSNLSGLTETVGGVQALIAPAGYIGATLAGVAVLLTPLRWSRAVLAVLAAVPVFALLLCSPTDAFTAIWCVVFAAALGLAAWKLNARLRGFLQIFLGVEAGLNAFRDLMTLLFISGSGAHIQTDADNMSRALFLPPMVWAVLWTLISVALLLGALWVLVRRELGWALRRRALTSSI